MDANMPDCLGETIAAVFAGGDLFVRPASYEIMLDVPVYLVMASGRVFRLFGECFREVSETDCFFLDTQKGEMVFSRLFYISSAWPIFETVFSKTVFLVPTAHPV